MRNRIGRQLEQIEEEIPWKWKKEKKEKRDMWEHLDELLAVILVVGCICLIALGIDSEVKSILTIATGWIFGREYYKRKPRKE